MTSTQDKTFTSTIPAMHIQTTGSQRWKTNEQKALKHGNRSTVFVPNKSASEKYTGQWMHNQKSGEGEYVTSTTKYHGSWANDMKHGYGTMWVKRQGIWQRTYKGYWKNNKKHGQGDFFYEDGSIYSGLWQDDERSGYGKQYYKDGNVIEGQWKHDKEHGNAIVLFANGDRYEGGFLNGLKHGHGVLYFVSEQRKLVGEWAHGMSKCGEISATSDEAEEPHPLPQVCHGIYLFTHVALPCQCRSSTFHCRSRAPRIVWTCTARRERCIGY